LIYVLQAQGRLDSVFAQFGNIAQQPEALTRTGAIPDIKLKQRHNR
jgi:hypothetical protein